MSLLDTGGAPSSYKLVYNPPSNFSYEMGRTWAVQIASQDFVQTGGVVPLILYLESFCS